ncbi:MAG: FkbM family methyltransferase [Bacteroidota bacterium]
MKKIKLVDNTLLFALRASEARMLDHHVEGYLTNGIEINDGDVVLDVGANIGVFGVRAAQKGKNVKVYCFEPIPEIADTLVKNADLVGGNQITVCKYGVSSEDTEAEFTYFPNTPALSTLHPDQWDKDPSAFKNAVKGTMKNPPNNMRWMKLIPTVFSGLIASYLVSGRKKVKCYLKTLSTFIRETKIQEIDLLKIDCEGAEWDVLIGIKNEDWCKIKSLVIEVHDVNNRLNKIQELLKKHGFSNIHCEREAGLETTPMFNLFALRS